MAIDIDSTNLEGGKLSAVLSSYLKSAFYEIKALVKKKLFRIV